MSTADPGLDAAIERVAETAPISSLVGRVGQLPSAAGRAMNDLGDRVVDRVMSTGSLVLVDGDCVEPSNLNRQILFVSSDLGRSQAPSGSGTLAWP